jgi:hypothetical protein
MCRRLWRWAPLSIGNPWDMGGKPVHRELWEIVEGGLGKRRISLYGRSVRGTWRGDFITGDPGRYVEKVLKMGISLHRGPAGEPGRGLIYRGCWKMIEGGL